MDGPLNHQLLLQFNQLINRNKFYNLFVIPRHPFIHNVHLFNTQVTTFVYLNRKTTENLTINSTKPNIVIMGSVASSLFVGSLIRVEFDQSLYSPLRIRCQLVLDVLGNSGVDLHRGNRLTYTHPKSIPFCNFFNFLR